MPAITAVSGLSVSGLEDVRRKLLSLPRTMGVSIARRGIYKAMNVIRDEARARVPQPPGLSRAGYERTGALKKAIVSQTTRSRERDVYTGSVSVQPRRRAAAQNVDPSELDLAARTGEGVNPRAYAHLVEFGARPHAVGAGDDLVERRTGKAGKQTGRMHPGAPPQPFLRPAYESGKEPAVAVLVDTVRRELQAELAKMEASNAARGRGRGAS